MQDNPIISFPKSTYFRSSILNETFIVTPRVIEIYMCKRQILIDFIILTSNNGRNLMTKFCLVGDVGGRGLSLETIASRESEEPGLRKTPAL